MKRTKNRILSVALTLVLLISALTACSSKESLPQAEGELWLGNVRIDGANEMSCSSLAVDISASFERLEHCEINPVPFLERFDVVSSNAFVLFSIFTHTRILH